MHKNTRLTPHHRQAIWLAYTQEKESVTSLARRYQVSRVTIYRTLKAARGRLLKPQTSTNNRFKQAKYGMKRLAKVERSIQEKLKKQAKRYNKSYPGEMVHLDTKRLPLLKGQKATDKRDYLFVAIDDFSRELYAAILPDKYVDVTNNSVICLKLAQQLKKLPTNVEEWNFCKANNVRQLFFFLIILILRLFLFSHIPLFAFSRPINGQLLLLLKHFLSSYPSLFKNKSGFLHLSTFLTMPDSRLIRSSIKSRKCTQRC